MRHTYECQLRWADMDLLGHINNVIYLDYLQEARIEMLLAHTPGDRLLALAEGAQVLHHCVQYVAPLTFRLQPVKVDTWVVRADTDSFVLGHEIYDDHDGERIVYLRARSTLAPFAFDEDRRRQLTAAELATLEGFRGEDPIPGEVAFQEPRDVEGGSYAMRVRFSDLDAFGVIDEVKHFEYFQEARVAFLRLVQGAEVGAAPPTPVVIARTDVAYAEPVRFQTAPFTVRSWVSGVGRSSFVVESELSCDGTTYSRARVVLVTFDPVTQKAAPATEEFRALLQAQLA
ncbi:acyl-CoA thioesterase [Nocardioides sp.]|uniref:acyl-CoA thioesterase n=1 Tax=Nocardioides sp. TaxID=35761 RepID=UPI002CADD718|nr:thioesterase family protein [Nocardioides sp.]HSX68962.1 thioesterase family protein [Nocardioides sp.]